jgi:hypothetical protein
LSTNRWYGFVSKYGTLKSTSEQNCLIIMFRKIAICAGIPYQHRESQPSCQVQLQWCAQPGTSIFEVRPNGWDKFEALRRRLHGIQKSVKALANSVIFWLDAMNATRKQFICQCRKEKHCHLGDEFEVFMGFWGIQFLDLRPVSISTVMPCTTLQGWRRRGTAHWWPQWSHMIFYRFSGLNHDPEGNMQHGMNICKLAAW